MPNVASESRIAERFANWLTKTTGQTHTISRGPDPPDFLIERQTWLEVSDIYESYEEAKFLNSPREKSFRLEGSPPDDVARRLLEKLDEKLGKTSYQKIHDERGAGILLLTCQNWHFDEVNLARVHEALPSFNPKNNQGFFRTVYFEYRPHAADEHVYEVIYLSKA